MKVLYYQNDKKIETPNKEIDGTVFNGQTDAWNAASKAMHGESHDKFRELGGMKNLDDTMMENGFVLALSLWDDGATKMKWLDGVYPPGSTNPSDARGPCPANSGDPTTSRAQHPNAHVVFSNIRIGPIGSTVAGE